MRDTEEKRSDTEEKRSIYEFYCITCRRREAHEIYNDNGVIYRSCLSCGEEVVIYEFNYDIGDLYE